MQPGLLDVTDSGETYLGVSQTIELPGRRSLRVKIARASSAEVSETVESERRDLILEVESAFYALLLAEEKLAHAQQNLELSQEFKQLAAVRYEAGDVAQVEILRAGVELARAESELRQAQNEVELTRARLTYLTGGTTAEPLQVTGDLHRATITAEVNQLIDMARAARPEVRALQHALTREELTEKQARRSLAPDLDLGMARHRIDGEGAFWDVTLSVPLPLFWQQHRGEVAEARANQRAVKHQLQHLEQTIALEVREAYRAAVTARDQIELFDEELLTEAREVYEMYLFSYREGGIGGIELIVARQSLLEARTSYADALFDYAVAVAALERAVGQDLEGALQ
jgi:outer membrane protein TolC